MPGAKTADSDTPDNKFGQRRCLIQMLNNLPSAPQVPFLFGSWCSLFLPVDADEKRGRRGTPTTRVACLKVRARATCRTWPRQFRSKSTGGFLFSIYLRIGDGEISSMVLAYSHTYTWFFPYPQRRVHDRSKSVQWMERDEISCSQFTMQMMYWIS